MTPEEKAFGRLLGVPLHSKEYNRVLDLIGACVTDHQYYGNLCSGFGGTVECWHVYYPSGNQCRKSPHQHYMPKHRKRTWSYDTD